MIRPPCITNWSSVSVRSLSAWVGDDQRVDGRGHAVEILLQRADVNLFRNASCELASAAATRPCNEGDEAARAEVERWLAGRGRAPLRLATGAIIEVRSWV